jgi:hypothetical protein
MTLVTGAEAVNLARSLPSGLHSRGTTILASMKHPDAGRPRSLILAEDVEHPGLWRIEWFDSAGAVYITVFAGPSAGERARDYHDAIRDGRLRTHLARSSR